MAKNPTYLTKNRLGVFIFQYRNPIYLVNHSTNVKAIFRISLHTRNYRVALCAARYWRVLMQNLIEKYFDDPELYGKAQALLMQFKQANSRGGYAEIEPFLAELDELDNYLLGRILDYEADVNKQNNAVFNEKLLAEYRRFSDANKNKNEQKLNLKLTDLVEKFIEEKKRNCSPKTAYSMEHKEYRPKLKLFIEVISDKSCGDLTKYDVSKFKDALFKLPKNRFHKAQYKALPIDKLIKLNLNADERITNTTIKNYATKIGIFIGWAIDNGYFNEGIKSPLKKIVKKTQRDDEERDAFTEDDLKRIFESRQYLEAAHKNNAHFWLPLLGLFTGARINELCQLYVEDVKQDEISEVWYLDINDNQDKKLKNINSKRIIPIHSALIDLGFVDYVNTLRSNNTERLFMELARTDEGYAAAFSKWFNRTYLNERNCNVGNAVNENKNFHSFRHTFINYYSQLGNVNMDQVANLVGQKAGDSVTTNRYSKPLAIDKKAKLIELIEFKHIRFDSIKRTTS